MRCHKQRHKEPRWAERLTVGVAARLSRYLQVLTQAKKMGKERISSQEISDYTNINATQIRRDLSAFGKFGKRGVGYNIDSLLGEIRKILRTQGQHNIALVGAGPARPGDRELADLRRARDQHRRRLRHRSGQGRADGRQRGVSDYGSLADAIREKNIIVGVLAVPADSAQQAADDLVDAGRQDHLQLLGGAARRSAGRRRAHVEPCGRAALRALLPPDLVAEWRVTNLRDARWMNHDTFGAAGVFEREYGAFEQLGINVRVLEPGQPNCLYHRENLQEDFLVLSGECTLLVDGEERPLKPWDFVHMPPDVDHVFVGAGDGPCAILMVGARSPDEELLLSGRARSRSGTARPPRRTLRRRTRRTRRSASAGPDRPAAVGQASLGPRP